MILAAVSMKEKKKEKNSTLKHDGRNANMMVPPFCNIN
jgi:hypothetical protein